MDYCRGNSWIAPTGYPLIGRCFHSNDKPQN